MSERDSEIRETSTAYGERDRAAHVATLVRTGKLQPPKLDLALLGHPPEVAIRMSASTALAYLRAER